jgi:hypothetical protein
LFAYRLRIASGRFDTCHYLLAEIPRVDDQVRDDLRAQGVQPTFERERVLRSEQPAHVPLRIDGAWNESQAIAAVHSAVPEAQVLSAVFEASPQWWEDPPLINAPVWPTPPTR